MQISSPRPLGSSCAAIIAFAEDVSARLDYRPGTTPIFYVLQRLRGWSGWDDRPGAADRRLLAAPDGRFWTRFASSTLSPAREDINLVQALGHFFLHRPAALAEEKDAWFSVPYATADESDQQRHRADFEAIWFSFGFMAPSWALLKALPGENGLDADSLAASLGTTRSFAAIQLRRLEALRARTQ